ncbi:4-hydroxy-3-methylbut-2-enyl diphosphate reductase [Paracraurococcus ruber]|uniref:4-hydroxy-3-methylbut-2-enyl diphosphate reductase n=1 Tax=Paracraurococcus ruber TaxID=77675 RepID=A0ABS1CX87_9PROT|nr:4-hydroxy-3-methylbut-2-enyl diphosphate reductase [Paracraurococcus ruber]MBK1659145.1 4-hydroxy-3-methylbut-2-enyl diphosphate reductase [Paracraurococcus ruber]TDG31911.1 4-hydroxy-3-methylbut-2-enyl diphosphate reductase [Paracraurococcus ruber]
MDQITTARPIADGSGKPRLNVLLAGPRGFCAGVDRAIKIVEEAIRRYGAPVYVRHEIVHNRFVVESLERQGAIFVEELDEVPDDAPVVFSAHGVPKAVPAEASRRKLFYLDATCPLVSKVHREAEHHFARGRHILLIGHAGHPEVVGTMGQLPDGAVTLVEDEEHARSVPVPDGMPLAFITQTTLSVDDTAGIVAALRERFPGVHAPAKEDICYATTNRQAAVKAIAPRAALMVVVGAPNSSNSLRLVEVAERAGCPKAVMVQRGRDLDLSLATGLGTIGITAGASAPEVLVEEVLARLRERFDVAIEEVVVAEERITFKLPAGLNA